MKITNYSLNNGLSVLLIDTQAFPSIATLLLVGAGSRYETAKNNGIAHFFEHMAFKGSRKYKTALAISTLLDSIGSVQNAFTSKDHTGFWIKAPLKHFNTVVDVLSDMVLYPLLDKEEIEREKGVIVEEINMYEDLPQYKVWDVFEELIFPNSSLGYSTAGTKQTVTRFKRETFTSYMDSLYRPNSSVLVVAGGLNGQEQPILNQVKQKFGKWQEAKTGGFNKTEIKQQGSKSSFFVKKTEQAHFILGYPALSRHDENRYALNVLSVILGGGMSSRLFYELRERRGLCYYIQTGLDQFDETGYLYTRAGVSVSKDKINLAISTIVKEQEKIKKGDVKKDELDKAKEMIKGRTILSLEDSFNLAQFFGKKALFGIKEQTIKQVFSKINKVNLEEVVELSKQVLKEDKQNLAIVSPYSKF